MVPVWRRYCHRERQDHMARRIVHDGSHLSLEERLIIQTGIEHRSPKSHIADSIGKDPTTVAKEVQRHRILRPRNTFNSANICIHLRECHGCKARCSRYEELACSLRDRSPGACNGCDRIRQCRLDKYLYDAKAAHDSYTAELSAAREGINLTPETRCRIGDLIAGPLAQGQSVYQILSSHKEEIGISQASLYNYIERGVFKEFGVDHFSLKEVVSRKRSYNKLKPRKQPAVYTHHTYKDYLDFLKANPEIPTTEMDTVFNSPEGPFIQTFLFYPSRFMIARLHPSRTSLSMASALDAIQDSLGNDLFHSLFSLILTDRGSEFEKIPLFEAHTMTGETRLSIFYCDPMQSSQKPHVENNHNYVRDIIPNKVSLARLSQDDLDLAFSHINSTPRKILGDKSPFEVFSFLHGQQAAHLMRISQIERDRVVLKPYLLKHVYK